jgi:hypothetical protein
MRATLLCAIALSLPACGKPGPVTEQEAISMARAELTRRYPTPGRLNDMNLIAETQDRAAAWRVYFYDPALAGFDATFFVDKETRQVVLLGFGQ